MKPNWLIGNKKCSYSMMGISFVILLLMVIVVISAKAQQPAQWFPRQRIPGTHDLAETPYLIADQSGTVHAFHSMPIGEDDPRIAIFYNKWTLDSGWTFPIDILLPFGGDRAYIQGALLDQKGVFHLIYSCCDDFSPNIFYSKAPAGQADRAPAWSFPELIGVNARQPHTASLAGDGDRNLFVLYSGNVSGFGNGLFALQSIDEGASWSDPAPVYLTNKPGFFVFGVRFGIQKDQEGRLHTVWSINNASGQGQEIYYSKLETNDEQWSSPLLLAETQENQVIQVTDPSIIPYGDELFVIYNEWVVGSTYRMMRRSTDGGRTWTDAAKPFASLGQYGEPDFVIDSNNDLHVFLGDRAGGLNLWHSVWEDNGWLNPEPIAPLSEYLAFSVGPLTFHPWWPEAVVSQGNVLLVTWSTDPGSSQNGTWYSYKVLDAPELPVELLPTLIPTPTPTSVPTSTPHIPTPVPKFNQDDLTMGLPDSPITTMILGIAPVVLLFIGVFILKFFNVFWRK